jgi:DNA (cytosine-5)-methyltransferase 1
MKLKIGTDCSGIEAPIQALKQMKIDFSHEWSCEIDKFAIESILGNYEPKIFFADMTKKRVLPNVDIYVCGFPCQSFSLAGHRLGMKEKKGMIFFHCLEAIKLSKPKVFILENVKGLISSNNGKEFKIVTDNLEKLKQYNVVYKVLNTKDYGIPQNRERIFFVGIRKEYQHSEFVWPIKCKSRDIRTYIDKKANYKEECFPSCKKFIKNRTGIFIDLGFSKYTSLNSYEKFTPTLATSATFWCVPMHRRATIKEKLSLQGFPKNFKQVVSDSQMSKQIGNSMSVNVLKCLFKSIFKCVDM